MIDASNSQLGCVLQVQKLRSNPWRSVCKPWADGMRLGSKAKMPRAPQHVMREESGWLQLSFPPPSGTSHFCHEEIERILEC
jgi:hypothetical protein